MTRNIALGVAVAFFLASPNIPPDPIEAKGAARFDVSRNRKGKIKAAICAAAHP